MTRTVPGVLILILSVGVAGTEAGEQPLHPHLSRKHTFFIGAFFQEAHAEMRETVDPLPRARVNLGHLGVDETDTSWYIEYRGRLWDRWGVAAGAQNFTAATGPSSGSVWVFTPLNSMPK